MGMEFVEKKILNNRTIDMAEHAVLMMCSYIPFGSWADQCEEFVETYGDQIVHLIVDTELTPQVKSVLHPRLKYGCFLGGPHIFPKGRSNSNQMGHKKRYDCLAQFCMASHAV